MRRHARLSDGLAVLAAAAALLGAVISARAADKKPNILCIGGSYLIVDTGPWIFGKHVMLPAGVIDRVDPEEEKVYVSATKEQIKNAPELEDVLRTDPSYRERLGVYYAGQGETAAESRRDLSM